MSHFSRRGFFNAAAVGLAGSAAIAGAQVSPASAGPSGSARRDRKFNMRFGVHMTNWQVLLQKNLITWNEIGRVSAELGFEGIELQGAGLEKMDRPGLKSIKDALTSHGLKIVAVNIGNN